MTSKIGEVSSVLVSRAEEATCPAACGSDPETGMGESRAGAALTDVHVWKSARLTSWQQHGLRVRVAL